MEQRSSSTRREWAHQTRLRYLNREPMGFPKVRAMEKVLFQFVDRREAGRQLAQKLSAMRLDNPLIYTLPRGGVPVAVEVARTLNAPLDLTLVRKIAAPDKSEIALGALVEGVKAQIFINKDVLKLSGDDMTSLEQGFADQLIELKRGKDRYVCKQRHLDPRGRTIVLVDDGLALGVTMKAALTAARRNGAARIIAALPVAPPEALAELKDYADTIICLHSSAGFREVSGYFQVCHQPSVAETTDLLQQCWTQEKSPETV